MRFTNPHTSMAAAAALAVAGTVALAGPVWEEGVGGDAGQLPPGGQVTSGSGVLGRIKGDLTELGVAGGQVIDIVDLFLVRVCDPDAFIASVLDEDGGLSAFGGRLYLFLQPEGEPPQGFGVLGNDDAFAGTIDPRLLPDANDESGGALTEPGLYWIAITREDVEAFSDNGPIFMFERPAEISGPDGDGSSVPIGAWEGGDGPGGPYEIVLGGITFGGTLPIDCNCNGIVDACDIAAGTSLDVNLDGIPDECGCRTDFDGDGTTGFHDLLPVLTTYGMSPGFPEDVACDGEVGMDDIMAILAAWGPCDDQGGEEGE